MVSSHPVDASMSSVTIPAAVTNRTPSVLAAGYPLGDGDKRLLSVPTPPTTPRWRPRRRSCSGPAGLCRGQVRLRLEREGIERLQHRKAGHPNAPLDPTLPALGHTRWSGFRTGLHRWESASSAASPNDEGEEDAGGADDQGAAEGNAGPDTTGVPQGPATAHEDRDRAVKSIPVRESRGGQLDL